MPTFADLRIPAALAAALALAACGEKKSEPAPPPQAPPAATAPATPTAPAAPAPAAPPEAAPPAAAPVAPPADSKPPPADAAKPAAAPKPAPQTEPAAAHAKVGADKCKMCHRVQHASWAASPHAAKGIDCEQCHGNGGDYWPASVMRDRAKAVAAGLVVPELASCKKCHGAKANAGLFEKVHAHKAR